MLDKIKNIINKTDDFFYKKFGSDKSIKILQNIKEVQIIFSILNSPGEETQTRFVGGCVRKALSGEKIDDIDLATIHSPGEVKKKLYTSNIKVIDTGITHGTLTAILNKKKFEITTLRKDISTDGRHANVEFTSDWEQDATRRDFTINAIYSDIHGRLFDPLNGISDLKNGIVKFIGSPEKRIHEDYLRILRYFRFFAHYSKIDYDENVIKIIKSNINGLNKISNERIYEEMKKILKLKNLQDLFLKKTSKEIILNIFPFFKNYDRLKILNKFSKQLKVKYDENLILALIIIDETNDYEYFSFKYKISNKLKSRFSYLAKNFENISNKKFFLEQNIKKEIYFFGKSNVLDLLLFAACTSKRIKVFEIEKLIDLVDIYKIPKFPISGDYLKMRGYKSDEKLGKKLKLLEEKWIQNNFVLDKKLVDKSINKIN